MCPSRLDKQLQRQRPRLYRQNAASSSLWCLLCELHPICACAQIHRRAASFPLHIVTRLRSCLPRQVTRPLLGIPAGRHGRRPAARRAPVFKRPGERREWLLGLRLCLQGERIPQRCGCTSWSHRYERSAYSRAFARARVCVCVRAWLVLSCG